jgi:hypothetical protein
MAVSANWTRALATTTATETLSLTSTISESGTSTYVDFYATVNAAARLFHRFVITFDNNGETQVPTITHYTFESAGDATYTPNQKTTPFTNAEADQSVTLDFATLALNTLYVDAGDARS